MAISTKFVEVGKSVVWTCRPSCHWRTPFALACTDFVERSVMTICVLPAMNVEVVSAGKSAFCFTFGIARVAARRPPVATAASVSLLALTGRAAVIDLLIAAFLAAVGENWRVSVFKRAWRLVDFWLKSYSEIKQNVGFGNWL